MILVQLLPTHFKPPIQYSHSLELIGLPVGVGVVNNVAERSCIRAIILNLGGILLSAGPIQVTVDERLHRVQVEHVLRNRVLRIRKDFRRKWLVKIAQLGEVKEQLPLLSVCSLELVNFHLLGPIVLLILN